MGRVIVSGAGQASYGILANALEVGTVVKLMEDGVATEFIVVNQGNPDASLYDESCGGVWLLRKEIKTTHKWNDTTQSAYNKSTIHTWLNNDYFNIFGSVERKAIKQIKIPYDLVSSLGEVKSGAEGLSTKCFLLGSYEIGVTAGYTPVDGAKLTYFDLGTTTAANTKRIAYLNQSANSWWLRSINYDSNYVWSITTSGGRDYAHTTASKCARPALILPLSAVFDETTLILKGVA